MTSTNQDPSLSIMDEDDTYLALLEMQRRFIREIHREQEEERERQRSMARQLGSVATIDDIVMKEPEKIQELTAAAALPKPITEDATGSKRPVDVVICEKDKPKRFKRSKRSRSKTFSQFDFDEIYFSHFEPEKKTCSSTKDERESSPEKIISVVSRKDEDSDREAEDQRIFNSIFRKEEVGVETRDDTPVTSRCPHLVSIVTDDDETECDREDSREKYYESDSDSDNDDEEDLTEEDPAVVAERFLAAMAKSSDSHEHFLSCDPELDVEESHVKAMKKSAESREKLLELLKKNPFTAADA